MKAQATAKLKFLRMSPRKVRLLVDLVRGLKVDKALAQLENNFKVASKPVLKLLKSAIANAEENHGMKEDTLVIKEAFVDGGPILYRWMPRAQGRATPIRKRSAHITLVLEGEVDEKLAKKKNKKVEKVEEKEPEKIEEKK